MTILTKANVSKNQAATFTLDKEELALVASVVGNNDFANPSNWKTIKLSYETPVGKQREIVVFDATNEDSTTLGQFLVSEKARDEFLLRKITIEDFDGGRHEIMRDEVSPEEFDVILQQLAIDLALTRSIGGESPSFYLEVGVARVAVQPDGKILINGGFTNYKGQTGKSYLLRLNSDGTEDTDFSNNAIVRDVNGTPTANFNGFINSTVLQSDGKILISGNFTNYKGQTGKSYLIRLNADGTEDTAFSNNAIVRDVNGTPTANFLNDSAIYGMAVQSNGKILLSGLFYYTTSTVLDEYGNIVDPYSRGSLLRLNADGTEDTDFSNTAVINFTNPSAFGGNFTPSSFLGLPMPTSIAIQSDGKILICGYFDAYKNQPGTVGVLRLNSDGTLDTDFSDSLTISGPGAKARFEGQVPGMTSDVVIEADDEGSAGNSIVLTGDGVKDIDTLISEHNAANPSVTASLISGDGSQVPGINEFIYFSGGEDPYGPASKFIYGLIGSMAVQSDGKILLGGLIYYYDILQETASSGFLFGLIRLNSNGTIDTTGLLNDPPTPPANGSFHPFPVLGGVAGIKVQPDGKILISGGFENYPGSFGNAPQPGKSYLIRLNSDGTEDTAFSDNIVVRDVNGTPTANFSSQPQSIEILPDGKIIVAGSFDYSVLPSEIVAKGLVVFYPS